MTELRGDVDLAQKTFGAYCGGELRPQHLDRNRAVKLQVLGEKHARHAAVADFPVDLIAAGDGGAQ